MHGLVKAVPSGDCVVVMGNAAQVSARVYPPPTPRDPTPRPVKKGF